MHISDITRWAACEQYGLTAGQRTRGGAPSAAAVVGTLAHAALERGMEYAAAYAHDFFPDRIRWDSVTPALPTAFTQARNIAVAARHEIERVGLTIMAQEEHVELDEAEGAFDLMCYSPALGDVIIDLKTGALPSTAWLQVGGYCFASGPNVKYGGVLHVPRRPQEREVVARLDVRPASGLVRAYATAYKRIQDVYKGQEAVRTPGLHCTRCPLTECAVRALREAKV